MMKKEERKIRKTNINANTINAAKGGDSVKY